MSFTISIGNKLDNRLQNLKYLTPSEHTILHKIGNKYTLGKKLSEEHKEKISAANIGRKHSEQSKAKIRAASTGRKHSEETKAKIRANNKKKQVYCVELDKVFEGINIAAKELHLRPDYISQCCNGKRKTTCGYHFQFV